MNGDVEKKEFLLTFEDLNIEETKANPKTEEEISNF